MKRRPFVKNISALTLGSLLAMRCKYEQTASVKDIGLQLWTVRNEMSADAKGTLKAVSDIGYNDVESAGYKEGTFYGMSPKEYKTYLGDIGLTQRSGHTRTGFLVPDQKGTMRNGFEQVCEDAAYMGQKSIICGWFSDEERKTIDNYKELAELFNKCGETAKSFGVQFAHHNHDFEFFKIDGQVPYDLLLAETDKDLVKYQLDLYWIEKANKNCFDYFEKHPGRFISWHVKDMDNTDKRFFTEVGNGIIDFKSIFEKQEQSGMQYFYVEQDDCGDNKPMDSIKTSHDYVSKMNGVRFKVSLG